MYLPAIGRAIRIRSATIAEPFKDGALQYLDPLSHHDGGSTHTLESEEPCARDLTCWVVVAKAVDPALGHSWAVIWLDKAAYRVRKIELYDQAGTLNRTLLYDHYRLHVNRHWRADRLSVADHRTGRTITFVSENHALATGLVGFGHDIFARPSALHRATGAIDD